MRRLNKYRVARMILYITQLPGALKLTARNRQAVYSYRRISTGFVLAATMAGIKAPTAAATIAVSTIRTAQAQSTSLGILLNM
jgi:hypothetical protein